MKTRDNGGPAFPRPMSEDRDGNEMIEEQRGMTLRQWYAGGVLRGLVVSLTPIEMQFLSVHRGTEAAEELRKSFCRIACDLADTMIAVEST